MTPPAGSGGDLPLRRCVGCGAKVKLAAGGGGRLPVLTCPGCGLSLAALESWEGAIPFVVPRIEREAAWRTLAAERQLPSDGGTRPIEARLLVVPYWIPAAGGSRAPRSAADLRPIGLPPVSDDEGVPRGLSLAESTRSGDRLGRLPEGVVMMTAFLVQVTRSPEGADPSAAMEALVRDPAAASWRLVGHPVWAFHYALHEKEHHHVVDAVTGSAVGPAHQVRWGEAALLSAGMMAVAGIALQGLLGPFAAIPAWVAGLAGLRIGIALRR